MIYEDFESILKQYEGKDELLEIYFSASEEEMIVGKVCRVFDEMDFDCDDDDEESFAVVGDSSVVLAAFTPEGEPDGLVWIPTYELAKICAGSKYLREEAKDFDTANAAQYKETSARGLDALLKISKDEAKIISLDTGEDESIICGIVEGYNDFFVQVKCFTAEGEDDGICYLEKDRIEICWYQGTEETEIQNMIK